MRKTLLLNIVELFVGIGFGYVNYELVSQQTSSKITSSIIIGLLVSLLIKSLIESYQNELRTNELKSTYQKILSGFSEKSQELSNFAKLVSYGTTVFPKEKAVKIWLDLLWLTSSKYWSINYINELWDANISEMALAIQTAKVRADNIDMRRVFIIDNKDEFEILKPIMKVQSDAGIKTRYIFRAELEKEQYIWKQLTKLDTLDVSLINSEIVFQVLLDKSRKIKSEKVQIDSKTCRELEELYSMIFDISHENNQKFFKE